MTMSTQTSGSTGVPQPQLELTAAALHRAGRVATQRAGADGHATPAHALEQDMLLLGIDLAHGHAEQLLETQPRLSEPGESIEAVENLDSVTELLRLAEHSTRGVPLEDHDGLSELVVELLDLEREARRLGY